MHDSPLWFRSTCSYAVAKLVLAAVASMTAAISEAQPFRADGQPDRYVLAPQYSCVTFDVDAFSRSQIKMRFPRINAQLEGTRTGLDSARVMVTIDTASVEARPRYLLVTLASAIGNSRPDDTLAFSATGDVSRGEFGLSAWFPTVGDAVHINIQVEFVHGP